LRAGARPQQALALPARRDDFLPWWRGHQLAIGLVRALRDRDAEAVVERGRDLVCHGDVPATDEERGDGSDVRIEPGNDPALDPAAVRLGRRQVLLAGEEKRDVDRHAGENRLLDRRYAF